MRFVAASIAIMTKLRIHTTASATGSSPAVDTYPKMSVRRTPPEKRIIGSWETMRPPPFPVAPSTIAEYCAFASVALAAIVTSHAHDVLSENCLSSTLLAERVQLAVLL